MAVIDGIQVAGGAERPAALESIVERAGDVGASDILLFHYDDGPMTVRVKVDGVWREWDSYNHSDGNMMLNRMKSAAGIPTGVLLVPYDKDWKPVIRDKQHVLRVAVHPAANGDKVAIRLQWDGAHLPLDGLGMALANLEEYKSLLSEPNGLICHVGPVGSGKTILQYGALGWISGPTKSVSTIEDPPERLIPGVAHMAINVDAGATFPVFMKSMLRGSDDVLLIGEMRDSETASAVLQLAKAGTLILSTIHANDNVTAIERLTEFSGLSRSSVTEAIRGFVSQRLLRKLHQDCEGNGCPTCDSSGYHGRAPIHELLVVTPELEDAIAEGSSSRQLRQLVREYGESRSLPTLTQDAWRLVTTGVTDEKELRRVLGNGQSHR